MGHITFSVSENCENLEDSYGAICVRCNRCGRWNKDTMYECKIEHYKKQLQKQYDEQDKIKIQEENIKSNIEYYENKIKEIEEIIKNKENKHGKND